MEDEELFDDILFGSDGEGEGDVVYNLDKKKRTKRNSEPYEQQIIDALVNDQSLQSLKHPPILTQRTVSTVSTSAPQIFTLQDGPPQRKMPSKLIPEEPNTPAPPRCAHRKLESPEDFKSSITEKASVRRPSKEYHSPISPKTPWKQERTPSPKEKDIFTACIKEPKDTSPNLIRYTDESSIVGTVPRSGFMKQILVTSNDEGRRKTLQKKFGSFTTISSLSFDGQLSPDTPKLVIGDPKSASKRILITVAVHGDEPCGMVAFNELLHEGFFATLPDDTSITAIVGNPAAVQKGVRFIEFNLNRMIRRDLFSKGAYESERARVIAREIDQCDVLLDLHSCSAKAAAHALPAHTNESIKLASLLPVGYVIKYLVHTTSGQATTVDWARARNKTSLCVECGQHDARATVDNAKNIIRTLVGLQTNQLSEEDISYAPVILNSKENETVRKGFRFVRPVKAFEMVPYGEIIAVDDIVGEIRSKYETGTYIVMPTRKPVFGEEAWFYAQRSENLFD